MSPPPRTSSKSHLGPRSRPNTQTPLSPSLLPTLHPNLDLDYDRTTLSSFSPSRSRSRSHATAHYHAHAYDLDDHATTLIELNDPGLAVQKAIEIVGKAIEYDTKGEYAVSLVFGCFTLFLLSSDGNRGLSASNVADFLYGVCDHGIWCDCMVRCNDTGGVQELPEFFGLFLDGHEV